MTKEPCQPDRCIARLKLEYDKQSISFIVSDFNGFVANVSSPTSLWEAILYETSNGEGSLRTRYQEARCQATSSAKPEPDMREIERVMNENLRKERAAKKLATTKPSRPKARYGDLTLESLGDLFSE